MNQDEKTAKLIEFWESRREYYELHNYVIDAERCHRHVCALRNDLV